MLFTDFYAQPAEGADQNQHDKFLQHYLYGKVLTALDYTRNRTADPSYVEAGSIVINNMRAAGILTSTDNGQFTIDYTRTPEALKLLSDIANKILELYRNGSEQDITGQLMTLAAVEL